MIGKFITLMFVFIVVIIGILPAQAANATVTNCTTFTGVGSISDAVAIVNSGGGTITFTCGGTIIFTNQLSILANVTINANGHNVIFDGGGSTRLFRVNFGASLTLNDFTWLGGFTLRNGSTTLGGAIRNDGTLSISHSTFINNSAMWGGAIDNYGTLSISHSTFTGNSATNNGGAIDNNFSTLTISHSTFANNSATNNGGAIVSYGGTLTINNSTFTGNSATNFGGAISNSGALSISNSTFTTNSATWDGGAIYNNSTLTTSNSIFTTNSATWGGAIYNGGTGTLTTNNSTFMGNSATNSGGAIINFGTLTIGTSTFTTNSAPSGGAIRNDGTASSQDTHYGDNTCTGTIANISGNTVINATGCPGSAPIALSVSSLFCVGNNATFIINAGDNNFNITGTGAGLPRFNVGTGTITLTGPSIWTHVTITERRGDRQSVNIGGIVCPPVVANATVTNCASFMGAGSISDAVAIVNSGGGTITFHCGGTINFTSQLTITNAVTINANGHNVTFDGGGSTRLFGVNFGASLTLNDFTWLGGFILRNGSTTHGGAIINSGTLTISHSTFMTNSARWGGAIINSGTLTINHSTFTGNSATTSGGAIYNDGTLSNSISHSTFTSNSAGWGGAIINYGTLSNSISHSTFTTNSATNFGGAILNYGTLSISNNSIFTDNWAPWGGAIVNDGTASSQDTHYGGNTCTVNPITDNGGNTVINATGCPGSAPIALSVSSLFCVGNNATFIINAGDNNFNITGTGAGLPRFNVGTGTITLTGPSIWTHVTITERRGDRQSLNIGGIVCPPVVANATVTNCASFMGAGSISDAVAIVNSGGGTITFMCGGTINFTSQLTITNAVTINANGNNVIFDGNNSTRFFGVNAGASLTLNGFILRNGNASASWGGAIINNSGGTLSISNSTFTNNSAMWDGGAIRNFGTLSISNSTFTNNSAMWDGGAIRNFGTLSISNNSIFTNNSASDDGGAIYNDGTLSISNSTFTNNSARWGGAIYNDGTLSISISNSTFTGNSARWGGAIGNVGAGTLSISTSTFRDNLATEWGGAIENFGTGTLDISHSTFRDNLAPHGGAISNLLNGTLTINGSTFTTNSAGSGGGGGAIRNNGTLDISHSTFTTNSAAFGGAIRNEGGTLSISSNSTFTNNSATHGGAIDNEGGTLSISSNSTFANNSALAGGAIYNDGTLTISSNSTFTNNSATNDGGAIFGDGTLTISGSTFTTNSAKRGGAIFGGGTLSISGSTFTTNSATNFGGAIDNRGTLSISSHSIFTNNSATSGGGAIFNNGTASSQDTHYGGNTCVGASISNISGNTRINATGCPGSAPIALSVSSLFCVGNNATFTINAGDNNFNITGTGGGLPLSDVGTGTITLTGPGIWTNITITERRGDRQSLNIGGITCPTSTIRMTENELRHEMMALLGGSNRINSVLPDFIAGTGMNMVVILDDGTVGTVAITITSQSGVHRIVLGAMTVSGAPAPSSFVNVVNAELLNLMMGAIDNFFITRTGSIQRIEFSQVAESELIFGYLP